VGTSTDTAINIFADGGLFCSGDATYQLKNVSFPSGKTIPVVFIYGK
jgi:hypothetical protein